MTIMNVDSLWVIPLSQSKLCFHNKHFRLFSESSSLDNETIPLALWPAPSYHVSQMCPKAPDKFKSDPSDTCTVVTF